MFRDYISFHSNIIKSSFFSTDTCCCIITSPEQLEVIPSNTRVFLVRREMNYNTLSFQPMDMKELEVMAIGSYNFICVMNVDLIHMNYLKYVEIGMGSFSGTDQPSSLKIKHCPLLTNLILRWGSFRNFQHLELIDLPSLQFLRIGNGCFSQLSRLELKSMYWRKV